MLNEDKEASVKEAETSKRPPKGWWDQKIKEVEGNDKAAIVGSIWAKLSDAEKETIRAREGGHFGSIRSATKRPQTQATVMKRWLEQYNPSLNAEINGYYKDDVAFIDVIVDDDEVSVKLARDFIESCFDQGILDAEDFTIGAKHYNDNGNKIVIPVVEIVYYKEMEKYI